jgi:hypothetical protein
MINNNMKHKHHIIPKHAGGSDDPSNLIELTIEEHAEAHRKLYEQYGRKQDLAAFLGLSGLADKKEIYKLLLDDRRGKPLSNEVKEKISNSLKGREHTWGHKVSASTKGKSRPWAIGNKNATVLKGRPRTEETKKKIAKSKTGKERPDMFGNNYATVLKGRKKTIEHKQAVLDALNTKEVKDKISASWSNKPKVTCPHCGITGTQGHNMNRYHFDNCKGLK